MGHRVGAGSFDVSHQAVQYYNIHTFRMPDAQSTHKISDPDLFAQNSVFAATMKYGAAIMKLSILCIIFAFSNASNDHQEFMCCSLSEGLCKLFLSTGDSFFIKQ